MAALHHSSYSKSEQTFTNAFLIPTTFPDQQCFQLFEKIVVCRLKWFLEYYNILTFTQSGLRQRRKTTDHILRLHDIIQKSLANKHNVLAIFIDIEKAYDMVNKNVLLLKLLKFGIAGCMFQFISSFLSNRTFQVRVGSTLSMTKLLENGTSQGSVLSPVLFSLMINDLPNTKITTPALYADDFCFWESGSDVILLNQLCQRSLTTACKWCDENGFKISGAKSAAVLLTKKRKPQPIKLLLQDHAELPMKIEYKYLGITFQRKGTYAVHIQKLAAKFRARLNVIRMLKGTFLGAGKRPLFTIYRSLVRSVIEHGMEAYFFSSSNMLKPLVKIQNDALRLCIGAMPSTPVVCLQHACNEMPLFLRHKQLCLKYKVHQLTFSAHPCMSQIEDCWQGRFPDTSDFCSFSVFTKTELNHLNFTGETLQISNIPTWLLRIPTVDLTLLYFVHQTRSVFIAPVFVSHLHNMYDQFVKIYADGSKILTKARCGIYVADKNLKYSTAFNQFSTSFTSELFAILQALYLIYSLKIVGAVIVTDSLSSLQSITIWQWKKHSFTNKIVLFSPLSVMGYEIKLLGYLFIKIFQETNWRKTTWQNFLQQNLQLKHPMMFSPNMLKLG